ncbi:small ribosomal subunit protein mS37 [Erinaceus europaeus]|uniref:Small ribosomal subunit protein mS37 n=1 Tax=Erinaceus europaeus TaxID=9365 RepID=A0A1S2ZJQ6_ERIEU|nr:small ribosomal subunit protein mS37 [Erinaceus europaeus]
MLGVRRAMAVPNLRGRLARLGNSQKPVLKPSRPLILANRVGERRRERGEATCVMEMSLMMACWKQNEFHDEACGKEIKNFFDCASKAEASRKMKSTQEIMGELGSLHPKKLNKLLQRFPSKSYVL